MKTRVMIFLSALLLGSLPAIAQTTIVTGVVRDSLTREGEPAAVLQFFQAENPEKPVAYTTTDEDINRKECSGHITNSGATTENVCFLPDNML